MEGFESKRTGGAIGGLKTKLAPNETRDQSRIVRGVFSSFAQGHVKT